MKYILKCFMNQLPFVIVGALILLSSVYNDKRIVNLVEKNNELISKNAKWQLQDAKLILKNTELINENLKSINKGVCSETDVRKTLNIIFESISYNRNKIMGVIDGEINVCPK